MNVDWLLFLLYTIIAVVIQGVFALFEMACISFNKMRLQYYVSLGEKRANWIDYLLKRPSRLFGTTLIGINVALQVGSECARRFYKALDLNPDWSPLTQVFFVVIFGELTPIFAAMRNPERLAISLAPFMIAMNKVFAPIIWTFDAVAHLIRRLFGQSQSVPLFFSLSREEIKLALEEKEEDEFSKAASRIFHLKNLNAEQLMTPLSEVQTVSPDTTLVDIRYLLNIHYTPSILVYQRRLNNIVGIVHLRDLLRMEEGQSVIDYSHPPWFVPQEASVLAILDQFRRNNQSVAVILDASGQSCGILLFNDILSQIFGSEWKTVDSKRVDIHVERTLLGSMTIFDFNQTFEGHLPGKEKETLSEMIARHLSHLPEKGDTVKIDNYLFKILEISMRRIKTVWVQTIR